MERGHFPCGVPSLTCTDAMCCTQSHLKMRHKRRNSQEKVFWKELRPKCLVNLEKWSQIGGGASENVAPKRPQSRPKMSKKWSRDVTNWKHSILTIETSLERLQVSENAPKMSRKRPENVPKTSDLWTEWNCPIAAAIQTLQMNLLINCWINFQQVSNLSGFIAMLRMLPNGWTKLQSIIIVILIDPADLTLLSELIHQRWLSKQRPIKQPGNSNRSKSSSRLR